MGTGNNIDSSTDQDLSGTNLWANLIGKVLTFEITFEDADDTYILFRDIKCLDDVDGKTGRHLRDHMWLRYTKKFKRLDNDTVLECGVKLQITGKINRYKTKRVIKMISYRPLHVYDPNGGAWRYTITNIKSIEVLPIVENEGNL